MIPAPYGNMTRDRLLEALHDLNENMIALGGQVVFTDKAAEVMQEHDLRIAIAKSSEHLRVLGELS